MHFFSSVIAYVTVRVTREQRRRRESAKETAERKKKKKSFFQHRSSHMRNFTSMPLLLELP